MVVLEDHREGEDEVEDIVDGEAGEVAIGRRLHRLASQHDDVDDVAETAEQDDRRNEQLERDRLYRVEYRSPLWQIIIHHRVLVIYLSLSASVARVPDAGPVTDVVVVVAHCCSHASLHYSQRCH